MTAKIDQMIGAYIQLRDKKKQIEDAAKEQLKPINAALDQLESVFGGIMARDGLDSLPTPHGTAYTSRLLSVKVADPGAWRHFVISTQAWSMADIRPLKEGVQSYLETTQRPPPGVNVDTIINVNVRRS